MQNSESYSSFELHRRSRSSKLLSFYVVPGSPHVHNTIVTSGEDKGFKKTKSVVLDRKRTLQTERPPLVGEVSAKFKRDRGCRVVSGTNPHGR
jgi:hypothetical protein